MIMQSISASAGVCEKKLVRFVITTLFLLLMCGMSTSAATVAKIGNKGYSNFPSALAKVKNGQTIKLVNNTSATYQLNSSYRSNLMLYNKKNVTIDLGGYTLRLKGANSSEKTLEIFDCSNITIKNGTIDGDLHYKGRSDKNVVYKVKVKGNGYADDGGDIGNTSCGTVTLKKVTVENLIANGTATYSGTTKHARYVIESGNYGFVLCENNASIKINGGTFAFKKDRKSVV